MHRAQQQQAARSSRCQPGDASADLQRSPGGHQDLQEGISQQDDL